RLLLSELTHRVKNTLTIVQGIAHQTQRYSNTNEDFIRRFDGRLFALGRAHSLLVEADWSGADLATLIRRQLEPYTSDNPDRIHITGEAFVLPPDIATPFGLVLHELATNAAKHGSFASPAGIIDVQWTIGTRNNEQFLTFIWREGGGPPVQPPRTKGFGSALIEKGIPHATVSREFRQDGLLCTIELSILNTARIGTVD